MYDDTPDRMDTPAGRIWAAIEDHTPRGQGRERLRLTLRQVAGGFPYDLKYTAALNGFLYGIKTPAGRQALRDFWDMLDSYGRKAA